MSDDICGAPTAEDTACKHPPTDEGDPGRCWIDSHNDAPVDLGQPGRPSKFTDDRVDDILTAAKRPINHRQIANAGGIARSTLYAWLGEYDEFSDSFRRARADAADELVRRALDPTDEIDRRFAQFILERSFQFIKTERHEVGLDTDHNIDAAEGVTAEFVTFSAEDDGGE